jgi:hypothetical protein
MFRSIFKNKTNQEPSQKQVNQMLSLTLEELINGVFSEMQSNKVGGDFTEVISPLLGIGTNFGEFQIRISVSANPDKFINPRYIRIHSKNEAGEPIVQDKIRM